MALARQIVFHPFVVSVVFENAADELGELSLFSRIELSFLQFGLLLDLAFEVSVAGSHKLDQIVDSEPYGPAAFDAHVEVHNRLFGRLLDVEAFDEPLEVFEVAAALSVDVYQTEGPLEVECGGVDEPLPALLD